jgi:hypothetical protein
MKDGRINNRISDLEKSVSRLEAKASRLEAVISTPRQNNSASVKKQNNSDQQDESASLATFSEGAPSYAREPHETSDHAIPWWRRIWRVIVRVFKWPRWKPVLEIIGLFAAVWYATVTHLQWQDARHNFQVDERAWIKAKTLNDINGVIMKGSIVPWNGETLIVWPVRLSNVGKSVATDIHSDVMLELLDSQQSPSLDFSKPHSQVDVSIFFSPG